MSTNKNNDALIREAKLDLLHQCLVFSKIPTNIPDELSEFQKDFETFKESIKTCTSSQDEEFLKALTILRDVLLPE